MKERNGVAEKMYKAEKAQELLEFSSGYFVFKDKFKSHICFLCWHSVQNARFVNTLNGKLKCT